MRAVPTLDAEMLQRFRPHVKDTSTCEMMAGLRDFPWDRRTWYCSIEDGFASTCSVRELKSKKRICDVIGENVPYRGANSVSPSQTPRDICRS